MLLRGSNLLALAVGLGAGLGCGDGDGSGGPGSTGVSGNTLLADISDAQAQKLCSFYEQSYKASLGTEQQYCNAWGAYGATSTEDCEVYRDDCLEQGDYKDDKDEDWGCDEATLEVFLVNQDECEATVSDFEACIKAQAAIEKAYNEMASCEDESSFAGTEQTEECVALFDKCPNLELP